MPERSVKVVIELSPSYIAKCFTDDNLLRQLNDDELARIASSVNMERQEREIKSAHQLERKNADYTACPKSI